MIGPIDWYSPPFLSCMGEGGNQTQIRRTKRPVLTLYLQINWNKTYPKMEWECSDCFKTVVVLFTTRSTKLDVFMKRLMSDGTNNTSTTVSRLRVIYIRPELELAPFDFVLPFNLYSSSSLQMRLYLLSSINSSFLWYTVWTCYILNVICLYSFFYRPNKRKKFHNNSNMNKLKFIFR